jgi:hypothetical protein
MPPLTFPHDLLRLLYWVFFKPLTLRRYAQQLHAELDEGLSIWELPQAERQKPALQELTRLVTTLLVAAPLALTVLIGLLYGGGYEIYDWWRSLSPIEGWTSREWIR